VLWRRLLAHLPVLAALLADPETTSLESSDTQTPYRPQWVEPWLPARDRRKSRKWLAKYAKYDRNSPTTKLGAPSAARIVGPISEPAVASRWWNTRWFRALALGLVVGGAVVLAIELHRRGHAQGDDFALYLRQAQSIFEGDIGAVVADNRFAVLNSDPQFSPIAYPWGWPLLLSPLVHAWGLDYDRLKLVEVALFAVWLVLMHGIVRRRIGRWTALAVVAVIGTAPQFLAHTDRLMSEFPYVATVGVVIWCYDRIHARASLLTARVVDLVVLGVLVATAFNRAARGHGADRGGRRDAGRRARRPRAPHPRQPCAPVGA
jgi:type IV secretory pathway VirB2 component (pilin)